MNTNLPRHAEDSQQFHAVAGRFIAVRSSRRARREKRPESLTLVPGPANSSRTFWLVSARPQI